MGKTVARASFSVKSKTKKKKPVGPPLKVPNLEKRSREYLTVSEVNQLIEAAKRALLQILGLKLRQVIRCVSPSGFPIMQPQIHP